MTSSRAFETACQDIPVTLRGDASLIADGESYAFVLWPRQQTLALSPVVLSHELVVDHARATSAAQPPAEDEWFANIDDEAMDFFDQ